MPPLLDVEGLTVTFGTSRVLDGVDIKVPHGSVVGVLGPNGAGKSTLLRTLAGLVAPTSGSIVYDGIRIDGLDAHEVSRRGICLIPEGRGILPGLTVADNLKVALAGAPGASEAVFEHFPVLGKRLEQPAGTLSGGEQQMLALARTLDDRVRLLLVDEPSLGLAPMLVDVVERTLRVLHSEHGRTVVWVEQYASRVLALADIVYILVRGQVVWAGEPSELKASPVLVRSYLGGSSA